MQSRFIGSVVGIVSIVATYVYFLIFAQFAFLEIIKERGFSSGLALVMAAMGLAGMIGSVVTGFLLKKADAALLLRLGFLGCAVVALGSAIFNSQSIASAIILSAGIGVFLSLLTVSLATSLSSFFFRERFALQVGAATGIAYLICNTPQLFLATPREQALFGAILCLIASMLPLFSSKKFVQKNLQHVAGVEGEHRGLGFFLIVICFLALVWFDSGAFFVIQQTTGLKSATWHDTHQLWENGGIHLIAALLAGAAIDKGFFPQLLLVAWGFLAAGIISLSGPGNIIDLSAPFYVVGVSIYSTALVLFPSLVAGGKQGLIEERVKAAVLYAVAGWFGSAMGIGMAQDLHAVPQWFVVLSGIVILFSSLILRSSREMIFSIGAACLPLILVNILFLTEADQVEEKSSASSAVELGHQVYVEEGCIHCHSQYVRDGTLDVKRYGKSTAVDDAVYSLPPLIGNRRQGPDLANVGTRRTAEWLKLHLISPREFFPTSVMPSYGYLFSSSRGEELVAYLKSLGVEQANAEAVADSAELPNLIDGAPKIYWLGHAGFLIEWSNKRVLLDPNLSEWCKILPRLESVPIPPEKLPHIDAAAISHGHYDHLDMPTLERASQIDYVIMANGSEDFLSENVKQRSKIVGLKLWEKFELGDLEIIGVPAKHGGSRYHPFRSKYFALGYVIRHHDLAIYFAGDTGFDEEQFAAIRDRYHPQVAILPIGGFEPRIILRSRHLSPEDAVRAAKSLGVRYVIPAHFGTFRMALDDPESALPRFKKAAGEGAISWLEPRKFTIAEAGGNLPTTNN